MSSAYFPVAPSGSRSQPATREAADLFVKDGFLDRFLDLVWHRDR